MTGISTMPMRLAAGGVIDRQRPIAFRFDGQPYAGFAGDTLASALLGAGVHFVGRSFKYHRPRGILTAGSEEPNALVELRTGSRREPNTRATVAELFDGLEAASQNNWPALSLDVGAINSLLAPLFVAGFYYKTFMWPPSWWEKVYEPLIRKAAGLGRASFAPDPDSYEKSHAFCDVLVVGAGPAGLAAALAAVRAGARVILADEDHLPGGRLNAERCEVDGKSGSDWARLAAEELSACPGVQVMRRTTVFGAFDGKTFGAIERVSDHVAIPLPGHPRQRFWKIVAKEIVVAAGASERPLVFGGNDRPGIMLASAARTYANRFGVAIGEKVSIFTTTDDGWRTASDLAQCGVPVVAVVDPRPAVASTLVERATQAGAAVYLGAAVIATRGRQRLRGITVRKSDGRTVRLATDALAMSGGWNPAVALTTHLGGAPVWSDAAGGFIPGDLPAGMSVAGAARGAYSLGQALREGSAAGARAAERAGFKPPGGVGPSAGDEPSQLAPCWHVAGSKGKSFVDFQNDVTVSDIALSEREGFRSVEHLKRYTTLGMATDQGKTSNVNGLALMAQLTNRRVSEVGTTRSRPPYTPVPIGALAGHHRGHDFRPTRLTPSHGWATELGATFVESGQWLRAQWFARPGEDDWLTSVSREVRSVRRHVGVCDVSTLGKIDVQGPDAGAFLDRVYVNLFSTLPVGKVRYGLMLREDGIVLDDGTSARLRSDHYVMSTTTANAGRVMQHLEHARQVLWPELDVQLVSVTDQWAQYAIAGPNSRRLLENLFGSQLDVSDGAVPYLGCVEFSWDGMPTRLFRISFSGELAYELAVPARYGDAVVRSLMEAGAGLGVVPYGTEALGVMRIEKGHVAGNEINGMTTAGDLGLGRMMSKKKDFIGRVLAGRPGLIDSNRPALVGIKPVDKRVRLGAGAHFLGLGAEPSLDNDQGYVTSVAFSPMTDHWVGLGVLQRGPQRIGEVVRAYDPVRGRDTEVVVTNPTFFDPEGKRLHG